MQCCSHVVLTYTRRPFRTPTRFWLLRRRLPCPITAHIQRHPQPQHPPKQAQHSARRLARVRGGAACRTHTPLVRLGALVVCVGATCHFQPRCAAPIPATEIPVSHAARHHPPRPHSPLRTAVGGTCRCHVVWCAAANHQHASDTAQRENQKRARWAICAPPSRLGLRVVVLKIDPRSRRGRF